MSDHYKLDAEGNPVLCDIAEWGHWFEANMEQRIVEKRRRTAWREPSYSGNRRTR